MSRTALLFTHTSRLTASPLESSSSTKRLCSGLGTSRIRNWTVLTAVGPTSVQALSLHQGQSLVQRRGRPKACQCHYVPKKLAYSSHSLSDNPTPEHFRFVMGHLTNSVVVCTSAKAGAPVGLTMSSLTSLTLYPTPLITFNIRVPSRTMDAITEAQCFNIHVLAADRDGADLAHHFATPKENQFEDVTYTTSLETRDAGGIPVLGDKSVLYVLQCRLYNDSQKPTLFRVRDHVIVVAEVMEVLRDGRRMSLQQVVEGNSSESLDEVATLAYSNKAYTSRRDEPILKLVPCHQQANTGSSTAKG